MCEMVFRGDFNFHFPYGNDTEHVSVSILARYYIFVDVSIQIFNLFFN